VIGVALSLHANILLIMCRISVVWIHLYIALILLLAHFYDKYETFI